MADKSSDSPVRIIGSRELHQNLPGILESLKTTAFDMSSPSTASREPS